MLRFPGFWFSSLVRISLKGSLQEIACAGRLIVREERWDQGLKISIHHQETESQPERELWPGPSLELDLDLYLRLTPSL